MVSVYLHQNGETTHADHVAPEWLHPEAGTALWLDLSQPTPEEGRFLSDTFHFHPLAVEDALSVLQFPKVEEYGEYLYLVLHGIDVKGGGHLATHDVDFFLGRHYLVTVHNGHSRSIAKLRDICGRHHHVLAEGPVAVMHRIVDAMVENYRPAVDAIEKGIESVEGEALRGHESLVRPVVKLRKDLAHMRRVLVPQRDAIGRLARREFPQITDEMAYRFRDVSDHVVRLAEEAFMFQDRLTGILEVHLATVSNRLNQVMKVLTVMSTIFLPMTVLTGMWGMNVELPAFPGGPSAQFWWIGGILLAITAMMLAIFRRLRWI
jgi:magnesium transporter